MPMLTLGIFSAVVSNILDFGGSAGRGLLERFSACQEQGWTL
jgi:hypothetical protein